MGPRSGLPRPSMSWCFTPRHSRHQGCCPAPRPQLPCPPVSSPEDRSLAGWVWGVCGAGGRGRSRPWGSHVPAPAGGGEEGRGGEDQTFPAAEPPRPWDTVLGLLCLGTVTNHRPSWDPRGWTGAARPDGSIVHARLCVPSETGTQESRRPWCLPLPWPRQPLGRPVSSRWARLLTFRPPRPACLYPL